MINLEPFWKLSIEADIEDAKYKIKCFSDHEL